MLIAARTALLAAALMLSTGLAEAAEIRVLSVRAAQPAVEALAAEFKKDTGHAIALSVGSPAEVMEKLKAGEIFDALVASEGAMDDFDRDGIVNPESRVPLASGSEAAAPGEAGSPASKILYEGALVSEGAVPEAARAFLAFLTSPDARSAWLAAKLEPPSRR